MRHQVAIAAGAFSLVFLLYGIISSSYLASQGFTYGRGSVDYVAFCSLVYALLGAGLGVFAGAGTTLVDRAVGIRARGVMLHWAYFSLAAASVFIFLHLSLRFLTRFVRVQDGPEYREHLPVWLLGMLALYTVGLLAAYGVFSRLRRGALVLALTWGLGGVAVAVTLQVHLKIVTGGGAGKDNVFLISVDTLRADHLNAYGGEGVETPALDALAKDGVVFNRAYSTAPYTWAALASLLTGKFTLNHGVRVNGWKLEPEHLTLAELFREADYSTAGVSDMSFQWMGFEQGFETLLSDDVGIFEVQPFRRLFPQIPTFSNWFATGHAETTSSLPQTLAALRWLRGVRRLERNFFWMHFFDDAPHEPYTSPEPYFSMYVPEGNASDFDGGISMLARFSSAELQPSDDDRARIRALYDGEITWCEQQIASLVQVLRDRGLYDSATIIVVADHGQMFGRRNAWGHGQFLFNSLLRVPLIIKPPGDAEFLRGNVVEAPVSIVDVFPTLAELYELRLPSAKIDGQSLVPFLREGIHPDYRFWHFAETLMYDSAMKPLAESVTGA